MRRFECQNCRNQVHFDNSRCLGCGSALGYRPLSNQMVILGSGDADAESACTNRNAIGCNWLSDGGGLCLSCLHTTKYPDLSDDRQRQLWASIERAKRRSFYALIRFGLPVATTADQSEGSLRFEILADQVHPDGKTRRVTTGHYKGRITINVDEADDAIRERNRTQLGEPYRTLIGHIRHETAHYFWDRLIAGRDIIHACRACFGDERQDYSDALKEYYANGPAQGWPTDFVSAYASAHPWEDFAETWAHYFHMVGGLETAYAYGLNPQPMHQGAPALVQLTDPYHVSDFDELIQHWIPLTIAMNGMNRSMGIQDYYPFALTPRISAKLKFVHDLIEAQ